MLVRDKEEVEEKERGRERYFRLMVSARRVCSRGTSQRLIMTAAAASLRDPRVNCGRRGRRVWGKGDDGGGYERRRTDLLPTERSFR